MIDLLMLYLIITNLGFIIKAIGITLLVLFVIYMIKEHFEIFIKIVLAIVVSYLLLIYYLSSNI